jgi:hypothetical protein
MDFRIDKVRRSGNYMVRELAKLGCNDRGSVLIGSTPLMEMVACLIRIFLTPQKVFIAFCLYMRQEKYLSLHSNARAFN